MLQIIIMESKTTGEFARRAEAWNASEAKPMTDQELARAFERARPLVMSVLGTKRAELVKLIGRYRKERLGSRDRMFRSLIKEAR